jgi:hypothetical protein
VLLPPLQVGCVLLMLLLMLLLMPLLFQVRVQGLSSVSGCVWVLMWKWVSVLMQLLLLPPPL